MKYIVTNVQFNALVNPNLLDNILCFAKRHKVDNLYMFVQNGRNHRQGKIDDRLFEAGFEHVEFLKLNNNLKLRDMKILAQQINPMTGMASKLSRDFTFILPSAKIRYLSIPNTSPHPRAIMTTGNLTKPNYRNNAHGRKAYQQHQYGFVFVEVKNGRKFSTYQVEATKKGDFHYMDERYYEGKVRKVKPEALILGDLHWGVTNPFAYKTSQEQIADLKPKKVVLHDVFNGHSINPHSADSLIRGIVKASSKRDSLESELKALHVELTALAKKFPRVQFLISESNHDIFLHRYIDSKKFIDQPRDIMTIVAMLPEVMKEKKPTLQIGLELFGAFPKNIKFLREDQECRVRGVEIGTHGHRGLNGSRGTSASFDRFNLKMISGHEHTPKLYANGMVVGTNTHLKLSYTRGPSSWMHANGILYSDGKYGLIPFTK